MDDDIRDREYLGDGVYIHHDSYQVWLTTERDGFRHAIALELGLPQAVVAYEKRIRAKYLPPTALEKPPCP
jgi:hypothetical protein